MNGKTRSKTMRRALTLGGVGAVAALVATFGWHRTSERSDARDAQGVEDARHAPPARVFAAAPAPAAEEARKPVPESAEPAVAQEPIRVPELQNPVLAATQARRFANDTEELAFWTERLRGERLTLENRKRSVEQADRVLESRARLGVDGTRELERRKALIEAKLLAQSRVVGEIEQRISELKRTGSNQ